MQNNQRTPEWFEAREGKFTASEFDKIITPTGKKSTQVEKLTNRMIAKMLRSRLDNEFSGSYATERGEELEPEARECYEFARNVTVEQCGFICADYYGCSPDGLVGDDGLLEIKCFFDESHVANMLTDKPYMDYYPQLQGQLLVTDREWVDWMSYHPELPPVIIRVGRDEKYINALEQYLADAKDMLKAKQQRLKDMGYL